MDERRNSQKTPDSNKHCSSTRPFSYPVRVAMATERSTPVLALRTFVFNLGRPWPDASWWPQAPSCFGKSMDPDPAYRIARFEVMALEARRFHDFLRRRIAESVVTTVLRRLSPGWLQQRLMGVALRESHGAVLEIWMTAESTSDRPAGVIIIPRQTKWMSERNLELRTVTRFVDSLRDLSLPP
ncbi:hypothetical protein MAPG_05764 [Magnaporthiopsis poae ATCC 64411]|uniref:Uncharacterized protein n=1 Tax=Magnaporthiopsis poae (strain ATCC 64411 / 73-15) TaxID=644358 RepID=A0A0C4E098_MAGP6|nr:hypothetical protein MAPG_05764 [Magnaporthiopsis poae ATCC 64411]